MALPNILPLTSFRFIAAMAVVIFHYDKKLQLFPAGLADFGYQAVSFFFVLSGFILTYTHARPSGLNVSLGQFARSRLVRIVPAYYLALIVAVPFLMASMLKAGHFAPENILVPAMLQSWWPPAALLWNSPAWSLSNEIFFYAVFPLIWALCRRLKPTTGLAAACALVVAVGVFRTTLTGDHWHNFAAYFPLLNLPQFVLGVSLGAIFLSNGPKSSSNAIFVASAVVLIGIIAFKKEHAWLGSDVILCTVFGTMIFALAGLRSALLSALSARWLVRLGEASYAIYILHVPIWMWWNRTTEVQLNLRWPPAIDFAGYLACVLLLSIAAMLAIERPARAWLKRSRTVAAPRYL